MGIQYGHIAPFLESASLKKRKRKLIGDKTNSSTVAVLPPKFFENLTLEAKKSVEICRFPICIINNVPVNF